MMGKIVGPWDIIRGHGGSILEGFAIQSWKLLRRWLQSCCEPLTGRSEPRLLRPMLDAVSFVVGIKRASKYTPRKRIGKIINVMSTIAISSREVRD